MTIVRYEPWRLVNRFHRDFSRFFDNGADEGASSGALSWLQPVDVREEESRFVVQVDLPGVDKKDIEITAEKGVLTIKGERRPRPRRRAAMSGRARRGSSSAASRCRRTRRRMPLPPSTPMACWK